MTAKLNGLRVWDGPTRLFHWMLVCLLVFSWWSAENHMMDWHHLSGIAVVGLIIFRLLWGVIGSSTARFSHFVHGPSVSIAYLRGLGGKVEQPGHNPLGGYSVILLLLLLTAQVTSGLFATDVDGLESGPLSYLVSFDQGRWAAQLHGFSFNLLLVGSGLHVLAILFYLVVRRRNLIMAMFTGSDRFYREGQAGMVAAGWLRLIVALLVAGLTAWYLWNGLSFTPVPTY